MDSLFKKCRETRGLINVIRKASEGLLRTHDSDDEESYNSLIQSLKEKQRSIQ